MSCGCRGYTPHIHTRNYPGGLLGPYHSSASDAELAGIETAEEISKGQRIRVLDVLVFGPFMIAAGLEARPPRWLRTAAILIGIGTIVYNGLNYIEQARRITDEQQRQ